MSASDRDALAKLLYDAEGFHAADHWGVETGITRSRYEGQAEAILASDWLADREAEAKRDVIAMLAARLDQMAGKPAVPTDEWGGAFDAGWSSARLQINESILRPKVDAHVRARAADLRDGGEG